MNLDTGATFLTAIGGLSVGWGGFWLSKRGQQDTKQQTEAAARVTEQSLQLDRWQEIALYEQRAREVAQADAERERARADRSEGRRDADRERFENELNRQRNAHQQTVRELMDIVTTLRGVVVSETASEAAKDAVAETVATDDIDDVLSQESPRRMEKPE